MKSINHTVQSILKAKIIAFSALLLLCPFVSFAQENDSTAKDETAVVADEKPAKDNRPVKDAFEGGYLINNQTVKIPTANTLEFIIQHRFGLLNSKEFDLAGLYAPSNIRIGLNYTFTNRLQFGIGTTKNNKLQDVTWKYALLKQTRSGSIPVSVTYFGDACIDVREGIFPKNSNRLSYFHQLIIARKFSNKLSLQFSPSIAHFNMVDSLVKHNNIGLSFNGRYKVSDVMAVLFEYDYNMTKQNSKVITVKPNLSIGIEAATSSHVFQVFVCTYDAIINQYNLLYNSHDFTKKQFLIGFNITRLWNY